MVWLVSSDVLHETYLPFTANQLRQHFAPVAGAGERDRHLQYYRASIEEARKYEELIRRGERPTRAQTRLGRQMEKDERFWVVTALMSLYHADDGSGRAKSFAGLLQRAGLRPPPGFPRWEDALVGALDLFFEVNLPSPRRYRTWLRDHLDERTPIPYLKEQAEARGARLEGTTKADAMLLAPASGVAVIFEAKVLSDISAHVTFDLARNQLARNIDVMLEVNSTLPAPLSSRKPERTFLVLLTPAPSRSPDQPGTRLARAGSTAGSCRLIKTRKARCYVSTYPTATATNWLNQPDDWGGQAGKTATQWSPAAARGLQPAKESGDDTTEFDPVNPTISSRQ
jgi:hypothetical protein